ncbi:MAG: hypothetical protein KGL37_12595 [Acidobacteriota bacterium]|nr:hypothetical protein [Acidobacteriota bacterium]
MRKITIVCCLLLLIPAFAHRAIAQDTAKAAAAAPAPAQPVHYYHLDFVVQELDAAGKPVNSRTYSTTVVTDSKYQNRTSIRTDARVPVPVVSGSVNAVDLKQQQQQWMYQNIGIRIDVLNAHEIGRQLALNLTADISSLVMPAGPTPHQPVTRQNNWQAGVLIPIGKRTVVFKSDDLDGKGAMELSVTATPLP